MTSSVTLLLKAAEERLWADFNAAGAYDHRGTIGTGREDALIAFLRLRLPARFGVARGEVVDIGGKRSGQLDVIIYDQVKNVPLNPDTNGTILLPAEALLAAIEVKSTLTKAEAEKVISGAAKLHKLRPWGSSWGWVRRGEAGTSQPRLLTTCIAWNSDLSSDWESDEIDRLRAAARALGQSVAIVDSVAVLSHGMVRPADGLVALEPDSRGVLGMWYFSLLGFLVREVERRDPVPWSYYEEAGARKWIRKAPAVLSRPSAKLRRGKAIWDYVRAGRRG